MYIYDIQSDRIHRTPKTLKSWKSLFSRCKISKITKNSPKTDHSIVIFSFFLNRYGVFYYGTWWIPMSRRYRIYMGKGGKGSLSGLQVADVDHRFEICCEVNSVLRKINTFLFLVRSWAPILRLHVLFISKRLDQN